MFGLSKRSLGFWIFLSGALLFSISYGQTPAPPVSEKPKSQNAGPQKKPATEQRGTEQSPVVIKILPAQESEAKAAQDTQERKEKAELDRKLVEFNRDLAFYTKILAVVAALQFLALAGQVIFLRLAFKESKRAADIARDAMVAGERAFVFATGLHQFWEQVPETGLYTWRFRPDWQNSGDTPTKNLTVHAACELRDTPLPDGFNFNYPTEDTAPGLLPPKITLQGGVVPPAPRPAISPQDLLDMQAGKKFLYMWGWARYFDVFPDTPQHITRFCWFITSVGNPLTFQPSSKVLAETLIFQYTIHREGNCADEECQ